VVLDTRLVEDDGVVQANSGRGEVKALVKLLLIKRQNFSFYPNATQNDVEEIMSDKTVKRYISLAWVFARVPVGYRGYCVLLRFP